MSPVEMCGTTKWRDDALRSLTSTLPAEQDEPGARDHVADDPPSLNGLRSLQEALIVTKHQLAVDLSHELQCDADRDQHGCAGEGEVLDVEQPQDDVQRDGHDGDEQRTGQRDAVDRFGEVSLGLWAGSQPGMNPPCRRIWSAWRMGSKAMELEVGERNDHQREQDDVDQSVAVDEVGVYPLLYGGPRAVAVAAAEEVVMSTGSSRTELAKMIGMTPLWLTLSGMSVF